MGAVCRRGCPRQWDCTLASARLTVDPPAASLHYGSDDEFHALVAEATTAQWQTRVTSGSELDGGLSRHRTVVWLLADQVFALLQPAG